MSSKTIWFAIRRSPVFWSLLALVALVAFNMVFTPNFARIEIHDGRLFGSMVDIFQNGAVVMLLAIGMTLVIAVAGIDLSVGSVMAISGAVAALLLTGEWVSTITLASAAPPALVSALSNPAIAVGAALLIAVAAGIWNGLLVSRVGLQPIVATLISLVAGRGIAQTLTRDQKIRFENPAFEFIGNGTLAGLPVPLIIVASLAAFVLFVLRMTTLGLSLEAIGSNARAARLCGIRVNALRTAVYGFSGLCAGVAGLIAAADIKEADVANAGLYLELDAILAVVIGGTSLTGGRPRIVGALIGALIMQTLTTMLQMRGVLTEHALIVKALVAIAVCAIQSPGAGDISDRIRRVHLFRDRPTHSGRVTGD